MTAYETTRRADDREEKRTTWPDGTVSTTLVGLDDSTAETSADGTVTTTQLSPHARFGNLSPVAGPTGPMASSRGPPTRCRGPPRTRTPPPSASTR